MIFLCSIAEDFSAVKGTTKNSKIIGKKGSGDDGERNHGEKWSQHRNYIAGGGGVVGIHETFTSV
jgi:hypothetical protein